MFLTIHPQPKLGNRETFRTLMAGVGLLISGLPALAGIDDGPPPPPLADRPDARIVFPAAPPIRVGSPATTAAGSRTAKQTSALSPDDIPADIDTGIAAVPAIVERLRSGETTPEEAWKDGEITDQDILNILGADAGGAYAEAGTLAGDLDPDLAGLLVDHYPARVKDMSKLKPCIRLWLADYYRMRQDPRAVEILRALIEEGKPHRTKDGRWVPRAYYTPFAARSLGEYYREIGDYRRAADAFLQVLPNSDGAALRANATVAAARMYARIGDKKTANDLYERALHYGDDWCTGLVYADEACDLMARHKLDDAAAILRRPTKGSIQIAILALLGDCCYRRGDFTGAEKYSGEAIALSKSIPLPPPQEGMDQALSAAQRCLDDSRLWSNAPFTCDTTPMIIVVRWPEGHATRKIDVRAFRPMNLIAYARSAALRVQVDTHWNTCEECSSTQIAVELDPATLRDSVEDIITLQSPECPSVHFEIPISIEVAPPIIVSPNTLFLGFVKAGVKSSGRFTLTSRLPFRITKVQCNSSEMGATAQAGGQVAAEHTFSFTYKGMPGKTWVEGVIRIGTDMPEQRDLSVRYFASVR